MTALMLVCRVLHIGATCTSLGGLFYARAVLWPTLRHLPRSEREAFLRAMIRRYAVIKWCGVAVITVTGIVQWVVVWPQVMNGSLYTLYFGIKMAGAVGLFSITALLALPAERLERMQANRGFWSALNIACGLTILIGAALMRTVPKAG
jgi:uncharacterized membrane protein